MCSPNSPEKVKQHPNRMSKADAPRLPIFLPRRALSPCLPAVLLQDYLIVFLPAQKEAQDQLFCPPPQSARRNGQHRPQPPPPISPRGADSFWFLGADSTLGGSTYEYLQYTTGGGRAASAGGIFQFQPGPTELPFVRPRAAAGVSHPIRCLFEPLLGLFHPLTPCPCGSMECGPPSCACPTWDCRADPLLCLTPSAPSLCLCSGTPEDEGGISPVRLRLLPLEPLGESS